MVENMTEAQKEEFLQKEMEKAGFTLDQEQNRKFRLFYDLLSEKNKVMNLTAIVEYRDVVEKHFADSVMPAGYLPMDHIKTVMDLGCGAGFPGIPLKICFPSIQITMLDSVGKKIRFVEESAGLLGLTDVKAMHARAEDLAQDPKYRAQYDLCTSRAVANLRTLSEYCLPFVKKGGIFAAYKAGDSQEEIDEAGNAIKILGGKIENVISYQVNDLSRKLVIIRKEKPTPGSYPRKAGIPSRKPL